MDDRLKADSGSPLEFVPGIQAPERLDGPNVWVVFQGSALLVSSTDGRVALPCVGALNELGLSPSAPQYLGTVNGIPCMTASIDPAAGAPAGWSFSGLRSLWDSLGETAFRLAGRALQIVDWDRNHRFCGRCGAATGRKAGERARECPSCGLTAYPRISPAVIVAVTRGDRILLARAGRFPPGQFSVLAGFADPGETLEECACREVREEVGVEIANLRYFASQPWPFPDSLMLAFTAEHASGEIVIDGKEILEAGWFTADSLPRLPPRVSVARRLIEWFVSGGRTAG